MTQTPPWAFPGAKVVCVKCGPWSNPLFGDYPRFGDVVTISHVEFSPADLVAHLSFSECSVTKFYRYDRFRPLNTQSKDLELFNKLLSPSDDEVEKIGQFDRTQEHEHEIAEDAGARLR